MDEHGRYAIELLQAILRASDNLRQLKWQDDTLFGYMPDGRQMPLSAHVRTRLDSVSPSPTYTGVITLTAYIGFAGNHIEASYRGDRIEGVEWRLDLYWNVQGFLIEGSVFAYNATNRYETETILHQLSERYSEGLEDCIEQLEAASLEMVSYREAVYEVHPKRVI